MNRGKDIAFALQWADEDGMPNLGEGISRTQDRKARLWSVSVSYSHNRVMHTTVLAISAKEAKKFSLNRHPQATEITVNGKAT